ncbi:hypothetical protein MKX01_007132 [Papaver californicum]|nr:hypothetical protein MKX01_007132 [Papaver californicum]
MKMMEIAELDMMFEYPSTTDAITPVNQQKVESVCRKPWENHSFGENQGREDDPSIVEDTITLVNQQKVESVRRKPRENHSFGENQGREDDPSIVEDNGNCDNKQVGIDNEAFYVKYEKMMKMAQLEMMFDYPSTADTITPVNWQKVESVLFQSAVNHGKTTLLEKIRGGKMIHQLLKEQRKSHRW